MNYTDPEVIHSMFTSIYLKGFKNITKGETGHRDCQQNNHGKYNLAVVKWIWFMKYGKHELAKRSIWIY